MKRFIVIKSTKPDIIEDNYLENLIASTLAGEPNTDLAEVDARWFPGLVSSGFLYPASDLGIFDFEEEKWTDTTVGQGTFDGKVYGFATGKLYPRGMMWWNKSMFEREGLPNLYELRDNKQWTWDKMLEIAKKATKDLDGDGIVDQYGLGGCDVAYAFVVSNGGSVLRMDGTKPIFTLNEPAAIEALQYYQDILHVHKVYDIPPEGVDWDFWIQRFKDGKVAMSASETWMAGDYEEGMGDNFGLTLFPMGPRLNEYTSLMTINNLTVIPATVNKPEEIAIYYNERSEPFPDDEPDDWKDSYSFAQDKETLESLEMVIEQNLSKFFQIGWFGELEELSWSFMWAINTANKTPQVAIDEIAEQAQTILDDAFSKE